MPKAATQVGRRETGPKNKTNKGIKYNSSKFDWNENIEKSVEERRKDPSNRAYRRTGYIKVSSTSL